MGGEGNKTRIIHPMHNKSIQLISEELSWVVMFYSFEFHDGCALWVFIRTTWESRTRPELTTFMGLRIRLGIRLVLTLTCPPFHFKGRGDHGMTESHSMCRGHICAPWMISREGGTTESLSMCRDHMCAPWMNQLVKELGCGPPYNCQFG